VFPVRYEYHVHTGEQSYSRDTPWRPIGVFHVRHEHYTHIRNKAMLVTGRGGLYACPLR
jgi:hypothetical protein